jgi:hypothetical protein
VSRAWRVVVALALLLASSPVAAQEAVQFQGTVQWVSGSTLVVVLEGPGGVAGYAVVGPYLVPIIGPRQTVSVDLAQVPQSEYAFMRPGERVVVIGVVDEDRRRILGTSIIRGAGPQAP